MNCANFDDGDARFGRPIAAIFEVYAKITVPFVPLGADNGRVVADAALKSACLLAPRSSTLGSRTVAVLLLGYRLPDVVVVWIPNHETPDTGLDGGDRSHSHPVDDAAF